MMVSVRMLLDVRTRFALSCRQPQAGSQTKVAGGEVTRRPDAATVPLHRRATQEEQFMTVAATSDARMRRNVVILAVALVLFQATQTMSIATTPLAAHAMLGADKALATVPVFLTNLGLMLVTLPAALFMGRVGRRAGFTVGAGLGILGGLTSFCGIWYQSFWLLCIGAFLQGGSGAFAWHYRFAAADSATADFRAKALSLVMAGGVLAGIIGPEVAKRSVDLFHPVLFAGVYVVLAVFAFGMLVLMQFVDIPFVKSAAGSSGGRPMSEIARQPTFIAAVLASMFGFATMTLVMSATPLAMKACGFAFGDSATVIQWHVIGMFLPSFFTGHLINRFGILPIIAAGAALELGCALVNLSGVAFSNFVVANVLVGLGWNFCYLGGSTLVTTTYRQEEKAKVQGVHDFCVYTTTATAAALSGTLQAQAGWDIVNLAALPMQGIILLAIGWLAVKRRRGTADALAW
jgi:MFS family permease